MSGVGPGAAHGETMDLEQAEGKMERGGFKRQGVKEFMKGKSGGRGEDEKG